MKHKTAELEGALLDAAVLLALGGKILSIPVLVRDAWGHVDYPYGENEYQTVFQPSKLHRHGGPIIERERITITCNFTHGWTALCGCPSDRICEGPTPLIAAMRAYVASRFGDEVELP